MADSTSSIPPSSSSRAVTSNASTPLMPNQVTPSNASETLNLLIKQAPYNLKEAKTPQTIEGKVIYSNPQAEEMRVKIGNEEIVLKTTLNLPHGTKILIKLYTNNNQLTANISIIDDNTIPLLTDENAIETPKIINNSNFPPIFQGQKLDAILTPNEKTQAIDGLLKMLAGLDKSKINLANFESDQTIIESLLFSAKPSEFLSNLTKIKIDYISELIKTLLIAKETSPLKKSTNFTGDVKKAYAQPRNQSPVNWEDTKNNQGQSYVPEDNGDDLLQILSNSLTSNNKTNNLNENILATQKSTVLTAENLEFIQGLSKSETIETNKNNSIKNYRIDILKIIPSTTALSNIIELVKNLSGQLGNSNLTEYTTFPVKIGIVESLTHEGFPVIKATTVNINNPYGEKETELFIIKQPVKIEKDSIILFKSVPTSNMAEQSKNIILDIAQLQPEGFEPFNDKNWPALDEALKLLNAANPQLAKTINNSLPAPNQNLPSTALLFLAALRFGSIEGWLGANMLQTLKTSGRDSLANSLKDNFERIINLSKENYIGDWKIISMPLLHEEKLDQIQIYINNEYEEQENDKNKKQIKSMRFIFNIELSRMGKMQLDGSLNRQKKLLNLTLRSTEKLLPYMHDEISLIFINTLERMDMKGEIHFQSGIHSLMKLEEIAQTSKDTLNNILV